RTDWPGVVRAVWKFHAFSRCWGDVGYNYLIDPNGNIYEGHRGGDNVMGTHAAEMNAASMGVALLGTFTTSSGGIDPPQPMLDSLVDMLAWKAEKEGIDPFDSTYVPIVRGGRPNIMGHRDAFGTTECPGQRAHAMLPEIRDEVGDRLGIDNKLIYIDDLIDQFVLSNSPNWREGRYNCGWDQHAFYTFSTTDVAQAVYWGEWTIDVPQDGRYRVEAMIPFCNTGRGETSSAFYELTHDKGSTIIKTDMQANVGLWADLGEFDFRGNEDYLLRLTDLTEDNGLGVWFDAIRLTPITVSSLPEPKVEVSGPGAGNIVNGQDVIFAWEVEDFYNPESIELTFSAATTATITATQVITSIVLPTDTVSTTWSFDTSYDPLYWQVFANGAKIGVSEIQTVTVDALPPVTQITNVILLNNGEYHLTWDGRDDLSGVASYLFQYQIESSEWVTITEAFERTQLRFTPPDPDATYGFRVRAIDQVGNTEEFRDLENSVSSVDAIRLTNDTFLSIISTEEGENATPQR
ncbi:MAG: N-acetylmuramoyl-L-alanine amidase, partial [Chloroflexota bacterium]